MPKITELVVPFVVPSGKLSVPKSRWVSFFRRRSFVKRISSVSVSKAKCELGRPGKTCPATLPAWQARQFITQPPRPSSTYPKAGPVPWAVRDLPSAHTGRRPFAVARRRSLWPPGFERFRPRLARDCRSFLIEVRRQKRLGPQQPVAALGGGFGLGIQTFLVRPQEIRDRASRTRL